MAKVFTVDTTYRRYLRPESHAFLPLGLEATASAWTEVNEGGARGGVPKAVQ